MNEQTPRDPQQPVGANDPTPQQPVAPTTDAQAQTTQQPVANPAADEAKPKRGAGILKPVLIGTGAAVAVLAVVGIGVGIADAIDDRDDQPQAGVTAPMATEGTSVPGQTQGSGGGSGDDQGGEQTMGPGNGASVLPSDFVDAIDAAVAAADGEGATSVELERDGWKVDVRLADGTEVEVRVYADDRAPVVQADDDDRTSDQLLDTSRIADIVEAAITAAGGGVVEKIETEDDDSHAFDVQVDLGGDRDVDVELADDLTVVSVDD